MVEDMNQVDVKVFEVGEIVKGQVTKVEEKQVIVDLENSKLDGIIPISELSSLHVEKASDVVSEGQELTLEVIKVEEDALILSKRKAEAVQAWKDLQVAFEAGNTIEAEIKEVVKGGLVVDLGVRGFVPASLVEDRFVEDFSDYKGKTLTFKIVELDVEKNRLILSHRHVLEEEKGKLRKQSLEKIESGQVMEGTVQRITDFGAFVDIGGVDGLVHVSQLAHQHVDKPSDVVEVGQTVKVKVLSVDRDNERISLSIKETQPGPWSNINEKAPRGTTLTGTVKRLVSYGAFVEVFPGVEGLVHISQISHKHIGTPGEVLKEGQTVQVKVIDVNEQEQRLSLSIKELEEKEEEVKDYELPEENKGFQLGEMIGDKLKDLKS
ncbi:30S ribosomal protein S1 [Bacillus carboniphilus]|uniref:30S ribosomal protein S1 n=1 Tax=Bacillus carboniphilus TaxID=86663 RepID=A0ABN0WV13_9BACI